MIIDETKLTWCEKLFIAVVSLVISLVGVVLILLGECDFDRVRAKSSHKFWRENFDSDEEVI